MRSKIRKLPENAINSIASIPVVLRSLLKDEAISGKLVIGFALIAVVLVNSPLSGMYESFWKTYLTVGLGDFVVSQDLRHWVTEGLMAFFFLVVGLEIKREIVSGELSSFRKASLPIVAAIGGMVVPAVIYLLFNLNTSAINGWGIPMATDIAFAVAILALLGNRIPLNLKLFLLTLAVVDDIGAIFVIALFYAEIINYFFLGLSAFLVIIMWLSRKFLANKLLLFGILAVVLWLFVHTSGIHASIVGAVVGLLAPTMKPRHKKSLNQRLEESVLPLSTFIALPVFALANAGVVLSLDIFNQPDGTQVMSGIIVGLIFGKLIGITGASWLMVKFGFSTLPKDVNWMHIIGVSLIAGIGFTVSIFITELAFADQLQTASLAKLSIFIASIIASIAGCLFLLKAGKISRQLKS